MGVEVKITHTRRGLMANGQWVEGNKDELKRNGALAISHWGATSVKLIIPPDATSTTGLEISSHCSTLHPDTFCRRRGVLIAMGRALKAAGIRI